MKFRWLLIGRQLEIWTDHKPLVYFLSSDKVSLKIIRWRLQLQEFSYVMKHCPGVQNQVADSLSRTFFVDKEDSDGEDISMEPFFDELGFKWKYGMNLDSQCFHHSQPQ